MDNFELYTMMEKNQENKNNILVTAIEGEAGKYLFSGGEPAAELGAKLTEEEIRLFSEEEQSRILETEDRKFFVERLKRPAHLVICGGGHVAQSVIRLAGKVGFFVTVLEDRPSYREVRTPISWLLPEDTDMTEYVLRQFRGNRMFMLG